MTMQEAPAATAGKAAAATADKAAGGVAAGGVAAGGHQNVSVPLNQRALVPMPPERMRRIREHLVRSLRAMRTMKHPESGASPLRPEPGGFVGSVARSACGLCGGFCCKGGGEHAYLDERDMARVRQARPELEARAVIRLYMDRVPAEGFAGSCVFHGAQGCTLDRALRSDVCNSYFCNGLRDFVATASGVASVVVTGVAADGTTQSTPVLTR
jgi:hypothetical protein